MTRAGASIVARWLAFLLVILTVAPAEARSWSDAQIDDLISEASRTPEEGLAPASAEIAVAEIMADLAQFDPIFVLQRNMAAETLFRSLALVYAQGAVSPSQVDDNWRMAAPPEPDYVGLDSALDAGERPSMLLRNLLPQSGEYGALRTELARLRAANTASGEQITRLRANLERWRWLPRAWPSPRLEVRIAEFRLYLVQPNEAAVTHDVIVGRPRTPTHVFAANIESLTLNPDWDPPASIVSGELLPHFRRNPAAAAAEGFEAIDASGQVIDPALVDWRVRPFPYHLRQRPGAQNALGRIRFNLPNPFSIYLHDTPARNLLDRTNRALSHGCIRVKDPVALGARLLADPIWDETALQAAIDSGAMQDVTLATPLPIFVLYLTATTQADGSILYLDDIYRRDDAIVRAIDHPNAIVAQAQAPAAPTCPS